MAKRKKKEQKETGGSLEVIDNKAIAQKINEDVRSIIEEEDRKKKKREE